MKAHSRDAGGGTLVVAGATGYGVWPANTLEGALRCLETPVDGIEIDVQLTADGHVVAHHDYWLEADATRLGGAWLGARGPALKTMNLADLRRYDVGRLKPGSKAERRHPEVEPIDEARIPTLGNLFEALKAVAGSRRLIYIEIKTDPQDTVASPEPEAIVEAVLRAVDAAVYAAETKIIAFDWKVLRLAKARAPAIATAHLTIPPVLADRVKLLPDGRSPWTDGCDPRDHGGSALAAIKAHGGEEWSPHFTEIGPERLAEARRLSLRVGPWGLSARDDVDRMIALGVFSATVSGPYWAA